MAEACQFATEDNFSCPNNDCIRRHNYKSPHWFGPWKSPNVIHSIFGEFESCTDYIQPSIEEKIYLNFMS